MGYCPSLAYHIHLPLNMRLSRAHISQKSSDSFFGFRHRRRRSLRLRFFASKVLACISQHTGGKKGLVGYSIYNCRSCMGTRFSTQSSMCILYRVRCWTVNTVIDDAFFSTSQPSLFLFSRSPLPNHLSSACPTPFASSETPPSSPDTPS